MPSFPATVRAASAASHAPVTSADASPDAGPPPAAPARAWPDAFAKGSRYWSVAAGWSHDASLGPIAFTQLHISHYLIDRLALEYGVILGYADARRTPAGALGGPEIGARWQVATGQRWSTYLEGLVGAVYQQHPLAVNTLRFNFDLQGGGGATYRLSNRAMLQGGFRWHHLSNAQVRGRAHNFGYDGPTLYLELMPAF